MTKQENVKTWDPARAAWAAWMPSFAPSKVSKLPQKPLGKAGQVRSKHPNLANESVRITRGQNFGIHHGPIMFRQPISVRQARARRIPPTPDLFDFDRPPQAVAAKWQHQRKVQRLLSRPEWGWSEEIPDLFSNPRSTI